MPIRSGLSAAMMKLRAASRAPMDLCAARVRDPIRSGHRRRPRGQDHADIMPKLETLCLGGNDVDDNEESASHALSERLTDARGGRLRAVWTAPRGAGASGARQQTSPGRVGGRGQSKKRVVAFDAS